MKLSINCFFKETLYPRAGGQNGFEQGIGVDSACAALIVVLTGVEDKQIDVFFHHFVDGVLQAAFHAFSIVSTVRVTFMRAGVESAWEQDFAEP